jgi:hypothetical protein
MLSVLRVWLMVVQVLLGVQFFLAGYGAIGTGTPSEAFALHIYNGRLLAVLILLSIPIAALARPGGRVVGMTGILFGLMIVQSLIAAVSVGGTVAGQLVFGLHAINALIIMGVLEATGRRVKRVAEARRSPAPESAPASA